MRNGLQKYNGLRKTFVGTFIKFGRKEYKGYFKITLLFKNIKRVNNQKNIITDHIWFNLTKEFDNIRLEPGDLISFDARIVEYYKGYKGYKEDLQMMKPIEKDYRLSHPRNIKKLKRRKKKTKQEKLI